MTTDSSMPDGADPTIWNLGRIHGDVLVVIRDSIAWASDAVEFTFRYSAAHQHVSEKLTPESAPLFSLEHGATFQWLPQAMGDTLLTFMRTFDVDAGRDPSAGIEVLSKAIATIQSADVPRFAGYASEGGALWVRLFKATEAWRIAVAADDVRAMAGADTYVREFAALLEAADGALKAAFASASRAQWDQYEAVQMKDPAWRKLMGIDRKYRDG